MADAWISQLNVQLNYMTVAANIARESAGSGGSKMSPMKTVKFGGGKIMTSVVTSRYRVFSRCICRVAGKISSLKYPEVLAAWYVPNHKRGQILQQDAVLRSHSCIVCIKVAQGFVGMILVLLRLASPVISYMNSIENVLG